MPENAFLLLLCQTACASARKKPRNTWFQGFFREYDHIGMSVMYGWPDLEAHSVGNPLLQDPVLQLLPWHVLPVQLPPAQPGFRPHCEPPVLTPIRLKMVSSSWPPF